MQVWEIATPSCAAGIVGTIAKESGTFGPVRESWWLSEAARWAYYNDTSKHAPYQGGANYHGRCFVQLTHVGNYQQAREGILKQTGRYIDLVGNPDLALEPENAADIICWFFASKGLVPLCEQGNWDEVRRRVYGAYDADGVAKLHHAARVLGA